MEWFPEIWKITRCKTCILVLYFLANVSVVAQEVKSQVAKRQSGESMYTEQQLLAEPGLIPALVASGKLKGDQIPDPHWRSDACFTCHSGTPSSQNAAGSSSDLDTFCSNCHQSDLTNNYHHPSAIEIHKTMRSRMPEPMRSTLINKKITCNTCHDMTIQCAKNNKQSQGLNPLFIRNGPYRTRGALCYSCHDEHAYKRLNPHNQINKNGKTDTRICGVCHKNIESLSSAKNIEEVEFNVTDDLNKLCTGCHPWIPHPGGGSLFGSNNRQPPNHLVLPSENVQEKIDDTLKHSSFILPTEPESGKIFCGSCHNPHAKGVITNEKAAAGAESKHRLRTSNICEQCHDL